MPHVLPAWLSMTVLIGDSASCLRPGSWISARIFQALTAKADQVRPTLQHTAARHRNTTTKNKRIYWATMWITWNGTMEWETMGWKIWTMETIGMELWYPPFDQHPWPTSIYVFSTIIWANAIYSFQLNLWGIWQHVNTKLSAQHPTGLCNHAGHQWADTQHPNKPLLP